MDRVVFQIQMRSLTDVVAHLRTLDLAGMETLAVTHGTDREMALIRAVRAALLTLP
jgi:hypothetical protein